MVVNSWHGLAFIFILGTVWIATIDNQSKYHIAQAGILVTAVLLGIAIKIFIDGVLQKFKNEPSDDKNVSN